MKKIMVIAIVICLCGCEPAWGDELNDTRADMGETLMRQLMEAGYEIEPDIKLVVKKSDFETEEVKKEKLEAMAIEGILSKKDIKLLRAIEKACIATGANMLSGINFAYYMKMIRYHYDQNEKLALDSEHGYKKKYVPMEKKEKQGKGEWRHFLDYLVADLEQRMEFFPEFKSNWVREVEIFMEKD